MGFSLGVRLGLITLIFILIAGFWVASFGYRNQEARAFCYALAQSPPRLWQGVVQVKSLEYAELKDWKVFQDSEWKSLSGVRVFLGKPKGFKALGFKNGEVLQGQSIFRCTDLHRNRAQFGFSFYEPLPKLKTVSPSQLKKIGHTQTLSLAMREFIQRRLQGFPKLTALSMATWLADESFFGEAFLEWHRGSGLGHVLAVSGQHVCILALLLGLVTRFFFMATLFWVRPQGKVLREVLEALPLLAAALLWVLCPEEGAVIRTAFVFFWVYFLNKMTWSTSRLQFLASLLGLSIVILPTLGTDWGIVLSALGFCSLAVFSQERTLKGYLWATTLIPVVLVPVQAHFFMRTDVLGVLHNLAFVWIWGLVILPLGFLLPFLPLPLAFLEMAFSRFEIAVTQCEIFSLALARPGFFEMLFWWLFFIGFIALLARCGVGCFSLKTRVE